MAVMIRLFLSCFLLIISTPSYSAPNQRQPLSADKCAAFFPYGFPKSTSSQSTFICREGYALEYDNMAKIPLWVSYTLSPAKALGCFDRASNFEIDRSLPDEYSAKRSDYSSSGYDIGHMANSADMRWSEQVSKESSMFSNAAPMTPSLNRRSWKHLEDWTRAYVIDTGSTVLIYSGTIRFSSRTIGKNKVAVPDKFFKVIVDIEKNTVMSFIYPQNAANDDPNAFITSIDEIINQSKMYVPLGWHMKHLKQFPLLKSKSIASSKKMVCTN